MSLDIYAPVIHGIGVRSHEDFAEESVAAIAAHLDASPTGWERVACPAGCAQFAAGHAHLRGADGLGLVVDPLVWFDVVDQPPRWRVAWWFLRALFVLCAVHLLVNGQVLAEGPTRPVRDLPAYLWRAVRAMAWILVLGAFAVALALPLTLAVALVPKARSLAVDALGWTSDPDTRRDVSGRVSSRVAAVDAAHTVLIGHSQGGAIAANISRDLDPARTTLITMGTGQALLAPISATLHVGWASIAALAASIVVYVAAAAVLMRWLVAAAFALVSTAILGALELGAAVWRATTDRAEALAHLGEARRLVTDLATTLVLSPDVLATLLSIPPIAAAVLVYARIFAPAVAEIRDLCHPAARGVDLCATFDFVSHPFTVLGARRRIRRVPQSASIADHLRYFPNSTEVLAAIDREISTLGVGRHRDTEAARAGREVRGLVRALRVTRAIAAAAAATAGFLATGALTPALATGYAAYLTATALKQWRWTSAQRAFRAARERASAAGG
ncbi:hypothetical protein [Microbacterium sp. ZXX196]|uniref:hypothetical protein n=1 Tax=Microbacterium sp. ZXX196 TaxID=2609291 RepID=UPI0012B7F291|nr:hypothetical protein [Microbacterium sp. ZXX196]MTE24217.1 hypothetical protein [Microbacterium sp. ZXX196]